VRAESRFGSDHAGQVEGDDGEDVRFEERIGGAECAREAAAAHDEQTREPRIGPDVRHRRRSGVEQCGSFVTGDGAREQGQGEGELARGGATGELGEMSER